MLAQGRPHREIPRGDGLEGGPEPVEGPHDTVLDKERMEGEEHEDEEEGRPDPGMEG